MLSAERQTTLPLFQFTCQFYRDRIAMIQNGWLFLVRCFFAPDNTNRSESFHFVTHSSVPETGKQSSRHRGTPLWRFCHEVCSRSHTCFYGVTVLNQKSG